MTKYNVAEGDMVRAATVDEAANLDALAAQQAAEDAEQAVRDEARQSALAKLSALGLTDAEIAALVGG